jgi:transcriptional regulator with XRE-family HTH domain
MVGWGVVEDPIPHPLAFARIQRGWSQGDLAQQVRKAAVARGLRSGVDRQRVWKWEHNQVVPDEDSQILLSDAFEVAESRIEELGWPSWLPGGDEPLPFGSAYTVQALREAHRSAMDRRTFITVSAGSLVGLAAQWALLEPDRLTGALTRVRR